jgi:hypothetical protein
LRARVAIFFWRHNLPLGLATHLIPPIEATLLLIGYGDLEALKSSRSGAHLQRYMTRTVEGIRAAGDIVMALGAWFQRPSLIALGAAVIILAWYSVLVHKSPVR